jgi:ankyrin repeat protein
MLRLQHLPPLRRQMRGNRADAVAVRKQRACAGRWPRRRGAMIGASPNIQNQMQDSAYLLAGAQGRLEIVRMTISYGADLKSTNRYGGTALIPACERGHLETAQALIAAGVDVNHVNRLGWTCLMEAVVLSDGGPRHQAIIQALIDAKADLNLPDKDGVTALAHARQRGQQAVVHMLQAAGAK